MPLNYKELEELTNDVLDFISHKLMKANRQDQLERYLVKIGFKEELNDISIKENKLLKILIIGESSIRENVIEGIFKEYGISKSRIEAVLDYEHAKKYNFEKLQWNSNYGAILFGPIPHSAKGKKDSSSIITEIEANEAYPECRRLIANGKLKINKSNLKEALENLIADGIIHQDITN
jgi:hypothetical protein